jgi:hypothetical protein
VAKFHHGTRQGWHLRHASPSPAPQRGWKRSFIKTYSIL